MYRCHLSDDLIAAFHNPERDVVPGRIGVLKEMPTPETLIAFGWFVRVNETKKRKKGLLIGELKLLDFNVIRHIQRLRYAVVFWQVQSNSSELLDFPFVLMSSMPTPSRASDALIPVIIAIIISLLQRHIICHCGDGRRRLE